MSQLMISLMSMFAGLMFSTMKHPMSMGVILLTQTALISLLTSSMSINSWFSYILFLVFIGGMLVLFIYMTSVASNELFQKSKNSLKMIIMIPLMIMTMLMVDPICLINTTNESEAIKNNYTESLTISMFNYPNNIMTTMVVMYLFLTLIVIVKITESHQGPIRSIN